MNRPAGHIDPAELQPDIDAYRTGDQGAGDRLCRRLTPPVRLAVARMLGDTDADLEDVIQESILASIGYLGGDRKFTGDPVRLAVTIARNRCRDHLRHRARRPHVEIEPLEVWLRDPSRSPLDDLTQSELRSHLQSALEQLGRACRRLLRAIFVNDLTPEQVRREIGMGTVQGVYYRRDACLGQLKKSLQRRWRFGSGSDAPPAARDGGGPKGTAG